MNRIMLPVGMSSFTEICRNNYYYIDKTGLIQDLLEKDFSSVTLITRPRRFGKTLAMSMLSAFFDIRGKNEKLFEGLYIATQKELCKKWMNQYPVIFLSMKNIDGLRFESAYEMLTLEIADLYKQHSYLLDSDTIDTDDKAIFSRIKENLASDAEIKKSLLLLTRMMKSYYQKPVIMLLDEYDVPIAKAEEKNYYAQMLDVISTMLGTALKDNEALRFAVITGCLRITKESIFTGANNFVTDTISDNRYNEYFGFTQSEVQTLLSDTGCQAYAEKIREWYDGYHFGDLDIYCPWDVLNYIRDLQSDNTAVPQSYWKKTSGNTIIRSFIDYAGASITRKLETLLEGGYIVQKIEEDLTYDYLHSSENNLWSVLYLTGYLTKVSGSAVMGLRNNGEVALTIPNLEVKEIFESTIMRWFDDNAKIWNREQLFTAVWNGDEQRITEELNKLLRRTISYHDYREDFYHAFLAGIFTGAGYMVESNREQGEGRSDIVIYNPVAGQVAIFEARYTRKLENLASDCDRAIAQIDDRMYAKEFEAEYDQVLCYGISFFKKRCIVKKK